MNLLNIYIQILLQRIKAIFINIKKKKFDLEISTLEDGRYYLSFRYYRFISIWKSLYYPRTLHTGNKLWVLKTWNDLEQVHKFANSILGIEDIKKYYKSFKNKTT